MMLVVGGLVAQSCPTVCNPWSVIHQAPLSMGFPSQEYWSRLPFPSPGNLPDPVIEPASIVFLHCQAGSLLTTREAPPIFTTLHFILCVYYNH